MLAPSTFIIVVSVTWNGRPLFRAARSWTTGRAIAEVVRRLKAVIIPQAYIFVYVLVVMRDERWLNLLS